MDTELASKLLAAALSAAARSRRTRSAVCCGWDGRPHRPWWTVRVPATPRTSSSTVTAMAPSASTSER